MSIKRELVKIRKEAEKEMLDLREYYQVNEALEDPDRIIEALDNIMLSKTLDEAQRVRHKAVKKMAFHCIFLMTTKEALGPKHPETALSLETEAKNLERFADLDDRGGKEALADKKRKEASQLKIRAAALRAKGSTI